MSSSNNNNISNDSNSRRCAAACKYLRTRCSQDCILSLYFPASNPHRFACVHKIFGTSNVTRMLQQLPANQQAPAARRTQISSEAYWRVQDPVYGSMGIITRLQHEIYLNQPVIALTQAQIAMYTPRQDQAQPNHPLEIQTQTQQLDPLAMTSPISQISYKAFHN